jgi:hypothetical protein
MGESGRNGKGDKELNTCAETRGGGETMVEVKVDFRVKISSFFTSHLLKESCFLQLNSFLLTQPPVSVKLSLAPASFHRYAMGRQHRRGNLQKEAVEGFPQRSTSHIWSKALAGVLVGASLTFVCLRFMPGWFGSQEISRDSFADPSTLGELLSLSPDQLFKVDIGRVNLLCAEGLPGAEHLSVTKGLATLDNWAMRVKSETERLLYRVRVPKYADHYQHSEAKFRAELLVQVLQEDCGVHYHAGFDPNQKTIPPTKDARDCFIHGIVSDTNGGNCVSMPTVYVAVGRRLGYPVKLFGGDEHVFCRWEGLDNPNPVWRERFNFDGAGNGFSIDPDEFYLHWPREARPDQVVRYQWLKTMSPSQELATFLLQRGNILRNNGRLHESQVAYAQAHQFWPENQMTGYWLTKTVDAEYPVISQVPQATDWRITPAQINNLRMNVESINTGNQRHMDSQNRGVVPPIPMSSSPLAGYSPQAP